MAQPRIRIAAALMLAAALALCASCRPGRRHSGPDLRTQLKARTAPAPRPEPPTDPDIRDVDFQNYTYRVNGESYTFTGGEWASEEPGASATVDRVLYGDLLGKGSEQAVVVLSGNWGGGNLVSGVVQVFGFHEGQAWEVVSLEGNSADISGNLLYVSYPEWDEWDPVCCPSLLVTDIYRWNGLAFIKEKTTRSATALAPGT